MKTDYRHSLENSVDVIKKNLQYCSHSVRNSIKKEVTNIITLFEELEQEKISKPIFTLEENSNLPVINKEQIAYYNGEMGRPNFIIFKNIVYDITIDRLKTKDIFWTEKTPNELEIFFENNPLEYTFFIENCKRVGRVI